MILIENIIIRFSNRLNDDFFSIVWMGIIFMQDIYVFL